MGRRLIQREGPRRSDRGGAVGVLLVAGEQDHGKFSLVTARICGQCGSIGSPPILFVPVTLAVGSGVYIYLGTLKSKVVKERPQLPIVTYVTFAVIHRHRGQG